MNPMDQLHYALWRLKLWDRDYGSYDDIDRDVSDGKLIPGTMPDGFSRSGDRWPKQSDEAVQRWVADRAQPRDQAP